jgi:hypothetical protein
MKDRLAVLAVVFSSACSPSQTAPTPNLSIAGAQPVSPANGTQIGFYKQPVVLAIANATTSTGATPVLNHVDIGTNAAFANVMQSRDLPQDGSSRTTFTLTTARRVHDLLLARADVGGRFSWPILEFIDLSGLSGHVHIPWPAPGDQ